VPHPQPRRLRHPSPVGANRRGQDPDHLRKAARRARGRRLVPMRAVRDGHGGPPGPHRDGRRGRQDPRRVVLRRPARPLGASAGATSGGGFGRAHRDTRRPRGGDPDDAGDDHPRRSPQGAHRAAVLLQGRHVRHLQGPDRGGRGRDDQELRSHRLRDRGGLRPDVPGAPQDRPGRGPVRPPLMTSTRNTRKDVVAAAGRLFASRGYHGTSMRDLGRELGMLGGSLYAHVDSKQDLLVEVVGEGAELFDAVAARAVATPGTAADRLRAFVEGHVGVVIDNLDVVRTYLNEARALDDVRRARVLAARDRYEGVLREILTEGAADGSFGPDVDKIDAIFILSVLNALERWYHPDGPVDREFLVGRIARFSEEGLRGRVRPSKAEAPPSSASAPFRTVPRRPSPNCARTRRAAACRPVVSPSQPMTAGAWGGAASTRSPMTTSI